MIELPVESLAFVQGIIQNFTIVATLILLYHFIPENLLVRSRLVRALVIGIIFGIAATLSIPALWVSSGEQVLGFNIILVPLAGYTGGPISSAFVAVILLLGCAASSGTLAATDVLTITSGILVGAFVWYGRSWNRFPTTVLVQLTILGAGVAIIEIVSGVISDVLRVDPMASARIPIIFEILPFVILSFGGTIVLGSLIVFIDRKKQAERELLDYQQHLEDMVRRRTAELRQANSLQKATIESTADSIVVVDRDGHIRAYNQKAAHILNLPRELPKEPGDCGPVMERISPLLADPIRIGTALEQLSESAEQIVSQSVRFQNGSVFELYVQPQRIGDEIMGRVYSFHDITDQRHAEEALLAAHNRLLLLSQITRHDILNQMTAVSIHLDLAREKGNDPASLASHFKTIEKTLGIIRMQMEFTRDYQDIGLHAPVWTDINAAFLTAAESFSECCITFRCETGPLRIYADPMIARVFHNFIDNSVRHGGKVTEIHLFTEHADSDLILVYEDDGTGILPGEKERIFQKGFGKHTGLGMFLIMEILSISGITIREAGTFGQGARFEILVPAGKFRFTS